MRSTGNWTRPCISTREGRGQLEAQACETQLRLLEMDHSLRADVQGLRAEQYEAVSRPLPTMA